MRPFFQNGTFTLTLVRDFYVLIDKTIGAGPSNPLRDTELTLARAHALPPMMSGFLHSIRPPAHIRRTKGSGGQKSVSVPSGRRYLSGVRGWKKAK